ncbi:MAG: asparagine synthase (glutamine-hydrolyzing) [Halobacteria archaeon]
MCGICGSLGPNDGPLLRSMIACLKHRGPDGDGTWEDDGVSLANTRLSIIDLPGGRQPMSNETGDAWTVLNGEIYNYIELRAELRKAGHRFATESDTEVIVHGYEEWGERFPERLRGMFAIALWDAKARKLLLVRDRVGKKPLYYTRAGGRLLFASEIKALLLDPAVPRRPNRDALDRFLRLRYVPGPETAFEGILKLPPGHLMVATRDSATVRPYWSLPDRLDERTEAAWVEELARLLDESVRLRLRSDVPVGLFLSGGTDSTAVGALATKYAGKMHSFSVGFDVPEVSEAERARAVASALGTEHHELTVDASAVDALPEVVWHTDEPVADPSALPIYLLSKMARQRVKVVLSGEGGDELFGGYFHHRVFRVEDRWRPVLRRVPGPLLSGAVKAIPRAFLARAFEYPAAVGPEEKARVVAYAGSMRRPLEERYLTVISPFRESDLRELRGPGPGGVGFGDPTAPPGSGAVERIARYEFDKWLPGYILEKSDKLTMAHGLELRAPLLDHHLVETAFRIPTHRKSRGRVPKYILRKAVARHLPRVELAPGKHPYYTPIDRWFPRLRPLYEEHLLSPEFRRRGYSTDYVKRLLDRHRSSPLIASRQLWCLLLVEMWHRAFIDPERVGTRSRA